MGAEEWPVLAAALLLLAISAMAAVATPGRRASLLEPSVTLRSEQAWGGTEARDKLYHSFLCSRSSTNA
jgi:hypothetical protein